LSETVFVTVTRTVKFKVDPRTHTGKLAALAATINVRNKAAAFYTDFFLSHSGIFREKTTDVVKRGKHAGEKRQRGLTAPEILSWAERHTLVTPAHPHPLVNFETACPGVPTDLRRAAIHHAAGAVRSYLTNRAHGEAADPPRRGQAPALPRPHPPLIAYQGICALRLEDYREGYLRLRLRDGGRWRGRNLPVQGPPYATTRCEQSPAEKARMARERAAQRLRMAQEGRAARTPEAREALRTVAQKQRQSGRAVQGERSNRSLWQSIRNRDDALAWRFASPIVPGAVMLGLEVLVFEPLRSYRPQRGLSWSRRTNRKRAYWLRGKVGKYVRSLALIHGILVVERNPAWTSRACPQCSHLAERFSPGGVGYPSRLACEHCGWTGDANVAAALNLKRKGDCTFRYPTKEEMIQTTAESRRAGNGGAASRANDRMAEALPA
jgi:hypothetical protein